jgi:exopolyphosphatase/guanosine-5'-triphosphate,3'-diphosphate pyrophosphatase
MPQIAKSRPERRSTPRLAPISPGTAAAIDLGSNSFHMIVAQVGSGRLQVIDRMKEMVRLAAGLDSGGRLTPEAMDRALRCLERFGQRLRGVPPEGVRAVGTNTLRRARNSTEFLVKAESALGHPIAVVAGREEARLIYLGVSHSLQDDGRRRLVADIGGGSTEFILGQHFQPERMESLFMGCVGMSLRFFGDGFIDAARMNAAILATRQEMETIQAQFLRAGWDTAIGASGSILSIRDAVVGEGWCKEGITASALRKLRKALIAAGQIGQIRFPAIQAERAPVFPGAVAILSGIFESLEIERMEVCQGSLREGLIYDLLGRIHHEDVRERTVEDLMRRYDIDPEQGALVQRTALRFLSQVAADWGLTSDEHKRWLRWAARVHEIGRAIAHSQYHKHGAYMLSNCDMPGFSRGEQAVLAALVRGHRRKFPEAEIKALIPKLTEPTRRLCVLLRLAVLLHRARTDDQTPTIKAEIRGQILELRFPKSWLERHPLTCADLEQEAQYLDAAGIGLAFR